MPTKERKEYLKEYLKSDTYKEYKKTENYKNTIKKSTKKYQDNNRELVRERCRKYGDNLRMKVLVHYSGDKPKCACCKEDNIEFLQLDHTNGGGLQHRKEQKFTGGRQIYAWIIKNNFPEGFRVLCANCNFSRGSRGYCPHRNLPEDKADCTT